MDVNYPLKIAKSQFKFETLAQTRSQSCVFQAFQIFNFFEVLQTPPQTKTLNLKLSILEVKL
ncbi:MAG: hypothetical protein AAY43_09565 [Methanosarcina sp. 795]|nr:MAG: hypothetical protein AAY43_09565 [Methanosarcina sp. 795]